MGVTLPVGRRGCRPLSLGSAAVRPEPWSTAAARLIAAAVLAAILGAATSGYWRDPGGRRSTDPTARPELFGAFSLRKRSLRRCGRHRLRRSWPKVLVACIVPRPAESLAPRFSRLKAPPLGYPEPRYDESGLLCAIDGYPANGCGAESGGHYAYWAYWHGGKRWQYANNGPAGWIVSRGDVEGWRFEPDGSASPTDPPPRASSAPVSSKWPAARALRPRPQRPRPERARPARSHTAGTDSGTRPIVFGSVVACSSY